MNSWVWKYLEELSNRLKKVLIFFFAIFIIALILPSPELKGSVFYYDTLTFWLIRLIEKSYLPPGAKLFTTSITSPLFIILEVALAISLIFTIPYAFYQIYGFIQPALYRREKEMLKKYILPFVFLYILGVIYTTVLVLPLTFRALVLLYEPLGIELLINIGDFLNMILMMNILGGLLFALPAMILPLIEIGVMRTRILTRNRILIYLIIAFIAGLISPDPTFLSVIPLLIPVYVLYEATVYIGKRIEKRFSK